MKRINVLTCILTLMLMSFPGTSIAYSDYYSQDEADYYDSYDQNSYTEPNLVKTVSDIEIVNENTPSIDTQKELELTLALETGTLAPDLNSPDHQRFVTNFASVLGNTINNLQASLTDLISNFSALCPSNKAQIKEYIKKLLEIRKKLKLLGGASFAGAAARTVVRARIAELTALIAQLRTEIENLRSQLEDLTYGDETNNSDEAIAIENELRSKIAELVAAIAEKAMLELALIDAQRQRMLESIEFSLHFLIKCLKDIGEREQRAREEQEEQLQAESYDSYNQ